MCPVTVYDPLFGDDDVALLALLGMDLPDANKVGSSTDQCGAYTLDQPTLAYMPHCPKELYESLLRANWAKHRLEQLVLCGNDMDNYPLADDRPAMHRISTCDRLPEPHTHRSAMPTYKDTPPGALDAVVHTFFHPLDLDPKMVAEGGWQYTAVPRRNRRGKAKRMPKTEALLPEDRAFWAMPATPIIDAAEVLTTAIDRLSVTPTETEHARTPPELD